MIQKQMKLNGSFGPAEPGTGEDTETQMDYGRVEADHFVFKSKFFSLAHLRPTAFEQLEEIFLIEFPGTVCIGISQG